MPKSKLAVVTYENGWRESIVLEGNVRIFTYGPCSRLFHVIDDVMQLPIACVKIEFPD